MINVTQSFLPPIEEYQKYIEKIWDSKWLTNRGSLVLELESKLKKMLNLNNLILTTNGTIPLQLAVKLLGRSGEIITTPFSYVATTSSIVWENCTPVFVDITPDYLTIDESKIEEAITEKTTAILATHVFGNPCNVEDIERIAQKNKIKVIYDAAHCFGVEYKNKSIFKYGDISTCSFHATKIFHTGEGGCMITKEKDLNDRLFSFHNFGHNGPLEFTNVGINGKMSEFQGAMGLSNLPYINEIINNRKHIVDVYNEKLNKEKLNFIKIRINTKWNYHYYPVIFNTEDILLNVIKKLNDKGIFPRRYFYPSLNKLNYLEKKVCMPISENISSRILCLPLYSDLSIKDQKIIIEIINNNC